MIRDDDDFIEQLEDYLDTYEGVVPLPARVRDAVNARLPATRQVRGAGRPERMLDMASRLSAPARWGVGIAAVLVVFVGAAALVPRAAAPGIGAVPTPTPSATPLPSASAGAIRLGAATVGSSCGDGIGHWCMPAGTYRLTSDSWPQTISFEVPEGWFPYGPGLESDGVLVESGPTAANGSGWGTLFLMVGDVSKDPCDAAAGRFPAAETATVDGLVAAMRSWPDFTVSDAQPIRVDGHDGQLVTVTSTRTATDCATQAMWATPGGTQIDAYPMVGVAGAARAGTFRILDIDGTLVVIRTTDFADPSPHELIQGVQPDPTRHAADQVEQQGIIDSIKIGS
jgi:hypothetical protein